MSNLEDEFGAPLFVRNKHSLELTELGQQLQKDGRRLANHYKTVVSNMQLAAKMVSGCLTIVGPSAYTGLLNEPYRLFKERYPNVTYSIKDCNSGAFDAPYYDVTNGDADFGITYSTYLPEQCADISVKTLGRECLDLLVPENHPLFGRDEASLGELRNTNILVSGFMGKDFIEKLTQTVDPAAGNTIKLIEMPNDNPILLASAGFGVSFIPHTLARIGEALNVLNQSDSKPSHAIIIDMDTFFDVDLIWQKNYVNPAVSLFLSVIP